MNKFALTVFAAALINSVHAANLHSLSQENAFPVQNNVALDHAAA